MNSFTDELSKYAFPWRRVGDWAARGAAISAAAIGTEFLAEGAVEWWKRRKKEKEHGDTFSNIMKAHPELKNFPYDKVLQYFNTLYKFSPALAQDPLAGGAFIRQAIRMDEYGGPPPDTIKGLADIEKKTVDLGGSGLGFKSTGAWTARDPF